MPNQDIVDVAEHDRLKALGIQMVNGEILPTSEHPVSGGNAEARRADYAPGTQKGTGSQ